MNSTWYPEIEEPIKSLFTCVVYTNGFYSIFCPHSQGLSPQRKRWLGKSTGATFTACSPWKTIQFRHWYISHIIKALSHRGSPDAKAQAVQCPQKVRTSPAYSPGVQHPSPILYVILFQLKGWRTAATEECRLRSACQTQHSSAVTEFSPIIKGGCPIQDSSPTNPVTPKSDWCQNSPATSPEILHHTV